MRTKPKWIAIGSFVLACSCAGAAHPVTGAEATDRGDGGVALTELRPLAEAGDASAEYRLGAMYALGRGVPRDYGKAAEWLGKAAAQGNARAQNDLGVLYDLGWGVPQDPRKAARLFRRAAEQGMSAAQTSLASMYRDGRGMPKDTVEAYAWADAAAQLGEPHAQRLLVSMAEAMTPTEVARAQQRAEAYRRKYVVPFRND